MDEEEEVWDVERVLDHSVVNGKSEFLVQWKGWPSEYNTWEPLDNLVDVTGEDPDQGCPERLKEYILLSRTLRYLKPVLDEDTKDPLIQRVLTEAEDECLLPASMLRMPAYRPVIEKLLSRLDSLGTYHQTPCIQEAARSLARRYILAEPSLAPLAPSAGLLPPRLFQETVAIKSLQQALERGDLPSSLVPKHQASLSKLVQRIANHKRPAPSLRSQAKSKRQMVAKGSAKERFVGLKTILADVLVPHDSVVNKLFVDGKLRQFAIRAITASSIRERYAGGQHAFALEAAPIVTWGVLQGIRSYMLTTACPTWVTIDEVIAGFKPAISKASDLYAVISDPDYDNEFIAHLHRELGIRVYYIVFRSLDGVSNREELCDCMSAQRKSGRSGGLTHDTLDALYHKVDNALARRQMQLAYLNAKYSTLPNRHSTPSSDDSAEESTTPLPHSQSFNALLPDEKGLVDDVHTSFLDSVAPSSPLAPGLSSEALENAGAMDAVSKQPPTNGQKKMQEKKKKADTQVKATSSPRAAAPLSPAAGEAGGGLDTEESTRTPVWVFNSIYLDELQDCLRSFIPRYRSTKEARYRARRRARQAEDAELHSVAPPQPSMQESQATGAASPLTSGYYVVGVQLSLSSAGPGSSVRVVKCRNGFLAVHFGDLYRYFDLTPDSLCGVSLPSSYLVEADLASSLEADEEGKEIDIEGKSSKGCSPRRPKVETFLSWPGVCLVLEHLQGADTPTSRKALRALDTLRTLLAP